jgi:hypothetical protein
MTYAGCLPYLTDAAPLRDCGADRLTPFGLCLSASARCATNASKYRIGCHAVRIVTESASRQLCRRGRAIVKRCVMLLRGDVPIEQSLRQRARLVREYCVVRWPAWTGVGERRWKKTSDEEVQPPKTLWDYSNC